MKITDFVGKENTCKFNYYRKGVAYYTVHHIYTADLYMFPVPLEDLADATINNIEKSIFMMRYIRKALDEGTMTKTRNL